MFRQILKGIEETQTDFIFLTEHDVLYHPSHFEFTPPRTDVYYYNKNVWALDVNTGQALYYDGMKQVSGLVAHRDLLLAHYRKRIAMVEKDGFTRKMGFEPGKPARHGGVDDYGYEYYESRFPNIDLKNHGSGVTRGRFKLSEYRCRKRIEGSWVLADEIPHWGKTKGRVDEFLRAI